MQAWSNSHDDEKALALLERAPSFLLLSAQQASLLISLLLNLGRRDVILHGRRCDKQFFIKVAERQTGNPIERRKLVDIASSLYDSTHIGVFEPFIVTRILYELMITNPNKAPNK